MDYTGQVNIPFDVILKELIASGMTHQKLAEWCMCSMPTIGALVSGKNKDPKYSVGTTLTQLHKSLSK